MGHLPPTPPPRPPPPPPPPSHFAQSLRLSLLTNPEYTAVTGVTKGSTRAHAPASCLSGELSVGKGGGGEEVRDSRLYASPHNPPVVSHFNTRNVLTVGHPPPTPSPHFVYPPLTNPDYTIVTGEAMGVQGPMPPPPPPSLRSLACTPLVEKSWLRQWIYMKCMWCVAYLL